MAVNSYRVMRMPAFDFFFKIVQFLIFVKLTILNHEGLKLLISSCFNSREIWAALKGRTNKSMGVWSGSTMIILSKRTNPVQWSQSCLGLENDKNGFASPSRYCVPCMMLCHLV